MHLADQPQRERKLFQSLQPVHHRIDVVRDLANVVDRLPSLCFGLEAEKVGEGGLRAFDLRGEDGLLADVHVEEQFLARQQHRDAVKTTNGAFGNTQPLQKAEDIDRRIGRQRRWDERTDDFAAHRRLHKSS